jgi:hypothetical protein
MDEPIVSLGGEPRESAVMSRAGRRAETDRGRRAPVDMRPEFRRMVGPEAAARLLGVTPGVLEAWGARFGFPRPILVDGPQRSYASRELIALRDALEGELSIPAAIHRARAGCFGTAAAPRPG